MNIVSIGEILWDVFENAEHIGGAPFNFSAHAARLGHNVLFVSAVGEDERGRRALERVNELGLTTRYILSTKEAATGHVTVFLDKAGQPNYTIHRPAAYDFLHLSEGDHSGNVRSISEQRPDWIYFGTLAQMSGLVRVTTKLLIVANAQARRFYDINLRKNSYNAQILRELMAETSILKINDDEVRVVREIFGEKPGSLEEFCRTYTQRFGWEGVCVTRGAAGCAVLLGGEYLESPGYKVHVADTVGAGDAFAAAFLHGLASKWPPGEIADFANRLGALVASRPGAIPELKQEEIRALSRD